MSLNAESNTPVSINTAAQGSRLRLFIRGLCLAGAIAAIWPVWPGVNSLLFIPALSPFVAVAALVGTRTFHAVIWLGLTVGLVVLIYHRFFCRWICPVGLCVDSAGWFGRRFGCQAMRGPLLGRWIVWITIGGALLGYPFLVWLDPLAIFANIPFLARLNSGPGIWIPTTGFVIIIILSIIWPRAWCTKICPLGAFQDMLFLARRSLNSVIRRSNTTDEKRIVGLRINRRTVLGIAAGSACAWLVRSGIEQTSLLRPPGALDELQFDGVCTRCGNCLRVCPSKIIERHSGRYGWAGLFTPVLRFENDYCREDCTRCTQVCPSGALVPFGLKEKPDIQIGFPRVDMNVCLLGDDRECSACKRWCPYDAIRYVFSETEYTLVPQINPRKCNGCGACQAACPTKPKKAIVVFRYPVQS